MYITAIPAGNSRRSALKEAWLTTLNGFSSPSLLLHPPADNILHLLHQPSAMPPKRPPLMAAVGAGRLDDAMAILAADPPPTCDVIVERDLNGWSALTHATRVGTHELVCAIPECKRVCERVRV
jgi:hypothetical protein